MKVVSYAYMNEKNVQKRKAIKLKSVFEHFYEVSRDEQLMIDSNM